VALWIITLGMADGELPLAMDREIRFRVRERGLTLTLAIPELRN
jgi:hypothetical protein